MKKEHKALERGLRKAHGKIAGRDVAHIMSKLPESRGLSRTRMCELINDPPEGISVSRTEQRIEIVLAG